MTGLGGSGSVVRHSLPQLIPGLAQTRITFQNFRDFDSGGSSHQPHGRLAVPRIHSKSAVSAYPVWQAPTRSRTK